MYLYIIISYNIRTQYKYIQAYDANHPLVLTFDNGQASWPATAVSTAHPPVPRSWIPKAAEGQGKSSNE